MEEEKEIIEVGRNIFVSRPKNFSNIVPLFCPICSFPLKTNEDSASYRKHECCKECERQWENDGNLNVPNKDSVGWAEYIKHRKNNSKVKINLK